MTIFSGPWYSVKFVCHNVSNSQMMTCHIFAVTRLLDALSGTEMTKDNIFAMNIRDEIVI